MIRRSRFSLLLIIFGILAFTCSAYADIDTADYRIHVYPKFIMKNHAYELFKTPQYNFDKPMDNVLIAIDANKSKTATVRSFVRVQFEDTGKWSQLKRFEIEFHYASSKTITAYQLFFSIRDSAKGETTIERYTVQAKLMGSEKMAKYLSENPVPFKAVKSVKKPTLVSRKEWGAVPPKGAYTQQVLKRIVMHHSYIPSQAQYKGAASIRGIQNYHMTNSNTGWNDIGYHFLIGPDGKIYQGRPETVVGAHCSPNTNSVGICVIGYYDEGQDKLNDKIESSIEDLLSWLCSEYDVDPSKNLYGHRDYSPKSCPGDYVYDNHPKYIKQILENIGK